MEISKAIFRFRNEQLVIYHPTKDDINLALDIIKTADEQTTSFVLKENMEIYGMI